MTLPPARHFVRFEGEELDAVVDTGFEGSVAVPRGFLDQHGIEQYVTTCTTADGRVVDTVGGIASIEWLGETWNACDVVELGDGEALVGMVLLNNTRIDLDTPRATIRRLRTPRATRKRT